MLSTLIFSREDAYGSTTFEIEGGNPEIAAAIFDAFSPSFKTDFKNWLESVPEYARPFDFKLGDITELLNFNVQSLFGDACSACFAYKKATNNAQCEINVNITYNCSEIKVKERQLTKQRWSLQRAIEVYMKEGPIPVYDVHIPSGRKDCEMDSVSSFGLSRLIPTWKELKSDASEIRIVFDMKRSIPGIVSAQEILQIKYLNNKWFVVRNERIRLFDSFPEIDTNATNVNVRGLVMTYDETTGLFEVDLNNKPPNAGDWLQGIVARAEYINPLKAAKERNQESDVRMIPCVYRWSNIHRFNPLDEGSCVRFTASSAGNIYVLLAVIPSDSNTWYYLVITPHGVALYKALKAQEIITDYGARGQGSDTLYQTYFVCVSVEHNKTSIWYGTANDNEEVGHNVYLSYIDAQDHLDVQFYTFGSGEENVDVMDISILSHTFVQFVCRGNLLPNNKTATPTDRACEKNCHTECDPYYSCHKPQDASACVKCKNKILVRHSDKVRECVEACPNGHEEEKREDGGIYCILSGRHMTCTLMHIV